MTFIMLVIIAIMIAYGITIMKSNSDSIESMYRILREEIESIRTERQQLWEKSNNTPKNS